MEKIRRINYFRSLSCTSCIFYVSDSEYERIRNTMKRHYRMTTLHNNNGLAQEENHCACSADVGVQGSYALSFQATRLETQWEKQLIYLR